jgi:hypothetical protein
MVFVAAVSSHAVEKKNFGSSMKLPKGGAVQMQGGGRFTVGGASGLGISGTFSCDCTGPKHTGSCKVTFDRIGINCFPSDTNGCTGSCSISGSTGSIY